MLSPEMLSPEMLSSEMLSRDACQRCLSELLPRDAFPRCFPEVLSQDAKMQHDAFEENMAIHTCCKTGAGKINATSSSRAKEKRRQA